jgi:hypothetical protein
VIIVSGYSLNNTVSTEQFLRFEVFTAVRRRMMMFWVFTYHG